MLIFILGWVGLPAALCRSKTLPLCLWSSEHVLEKLIRWVKAILTIIMIQTPKKWALISDFPENSLNFLHKYGYKNGGRGLMRSPFSPIFINVYISRFLCRWKQKSITFFCVVIIDKRRVRRWSYTEKKKGITCNETESSKRVADHSRGILALH